jgi:hypothetical protein
VSGYLHGLVARTSGAPVADAASARARRPPRFPIGAAGGAPTVADPESREGRPGRALGAPATALPRGERFDDEPRVEVALAEPRVVRTVAGRPAPAAPSAAAPSPAAAPAPTTAPPPTRTRAHVEDPAPPRVRARPHDVVPDERDSGSAPQPPATVRLRPAPAPAPAAPTTPPRIEVHIGRVEVRRPAAPAPAPPAQGDAGPSRRAPRGFGELAAARRYVDRLGR